MLVGSAALDPVHKGGCKPAHDSAIRYDFGLARCLNLAGGGQDIKAGRVLQGTELTLHISPQIGGSTAKATVSSRTTASQSEFSTISRSCRAGIDVACNAVDLVSAVARQSLPLRSSLPWPA